MHSHPVFGFLVFAVVLTLVERLTEESVILDDGTELPADLVVYATGFGSMIGVHSLHSGSKRLPRKPPQGPGRFRAKPQPR